MASRWRLGARGTLTSEDSINETSQGLLMASPAALAQARKAALVQRIDQIAALNTWPRDADGRVHPQGVAMFGGWGFSILTPLGRAGPAVRWTPQNR